jgi:hypothetical protein
VREVAGERAKHFLLSARCWRRTVQLAAPLHSVSPAGQALPTEVAGNGNIFPPFLNARTFPLCFQAFSGVASPLLSSGRDIIA